MACRCKRVHTATTAAPGVLGLAPTNVLVLVVARPQKPGDGGDGTAGRQPSGAEAEAASNVSDTCGDAAAAKGGLSGSTPHGDAAAVEAHAPASSRRSSGSKAPTTAGSSPEESSSVDASSWQQQCRWISHGLNGRRSSVVVPFFALFQAAGAGSAGRGLKLRRDRQRVLEYLQHLEELAAHYADVSCRELLGLGRSGKAGGHVWVSPWTGWRVRPCMAASLA